MIFHSHGIVISLSLLSCRAVSGNVENLPPPLIGSWPLFASPPPTTQAAGTCPTQSYCNTWRRALGGPLRCKGEASHLLRYQRSTVQSQSDRIARCGPSKTLPPAFSLFCPSFHCPVEKSALVASLTSSSVSTILGNGAS